MDWFTFLGRKEGATDYTQRIFHILNDLGSIKRGQDVEGGWLCRDKTLIVDEFWNPLIHFMATDTVSVNSHYMLDFFLWLLRLGNGFEPKLSIYLKMSLADHNIRASRKFLEHHDLDVNQMPSVNNSTSEADRNYDNAIGLLSSKLPYLHVFDATLPEAEVHAKVLDLVRRTI